jgi:hypothetical protein
MSLTFLVWLGIEVRNIDSIVDEDDAFYDTVAFDSNDQCFTQLGPNCAPIIDADLNLHEADTIAKTPFHIATGATEYDGSTIQGWASAAFTAQAKWDSGPVDEHFVGLFGPDGDGMPKEEEEDSKLTATQRSNIFKDLTDDDSDEDQSNEETPFNLLNTKVSSNPKVPHLNF